MGMENKIVPLICPIGGITTTLIKYILLLFFYQSIFYIISI